MLGRTPEMLKFCPTDFIFESVKENELKGRQKLKQRKKM